MSRFSEWMAGLRESGQVQAITEDYGGLPEHWRQEYIEQRTREIEEAADRYAEGLAERREAEAGEARVRVMHHMWHPSDFDPTTGAIINSGGTLPNEEVLFNPGAYSIEPTWELSVSNAISDKYKEMEKRVEEQDKTIAEMKSIIENLQDIVYQRKLDKEAENLVL